MGGVKINPRTYGYICIFCDTNQVDNMSQCGHACFCNTCAELCVKWNLDCPICKISITIISQREAGYLWNTYVDSTFKLLSETMREKFNKQLEELVSNVIRYSETFKNPIVNMINQQNKYTISSPNT